MFFKMGPLLLVYMCCARGQAPWRGIPDNPEQANEPLVAPKHVQPINFLVILADGGCERIWCFP